MGWNSGYTIFEATVMEAYNLGKLDRPLLEVLMSPYDGTDIDSGGSHHLISHDGLTIEEVVVKVMGLPMPEKPTFNQENRTREADKASQRYHDAIYILFYESTPASKWR